jgi:hypothetical protein
VGYGACKAKTAGRPSATGEAKGAIYARKARGDLSRQSAYLRERLAPEGVFPMREVTDVASG